MAVLTDEDLIARCRAELPSDTRSYELLVQRHMNRVYSLVHRIVANKEEAEDITQEVFLKVYNNMKKFEQQSSFSTWLYRVATNTALDALDKINRRPQTAPSNSGQNAENEEKSDLLHLQPSTMAGPEESVIQAELRDCISGVLKKLDREQARLLVMRDFDDLSYDEISKMFELGLSAVKMRIHRARLAFQEVFNQFCGRIYLNFSVSSGGKTREKKE